MIPHVGRLAFNAINFEAVRCEPPELPGESPEITASDWHDGT
jgi:hypothetical protein